MGKLDEFCISTAASKGETVEMSSTCFDVGRSVLSPLHTISVEIKRLSFDFNS